MPKIFNPTHFGVQSLFSSAFMGAGVFTTLLATRIIRTGNPDPISLLFAPIVGASLGIAARAAGVVLEKLFQGATNKNTTPEFPELPV